MEPTDHASEAGDDPVWAERLNLRAPGVQSPSVDALSPSEPHGGWRFLLKTTARKAEKETMEATTPRTSRRPRQVAIVALVVAVSLLTACLRPTQAQVLDELNADRKANGRRVLPTQVDAQNKAQAWAERLARENRLYHSTLSNGINTKWCSLGENVGYGPSAAAIQDGYMGSSGHRANVLNTKWNGVGVGYATNGNRVYTVQVFIKTC
jgi:uncharacterized protein YkwD